jgi:hypothetical protein
MESLLYNSHIIKFEQYVLQIIAFWDLATCSLLDRYNIFIGTCCLHIQEKRRKNFSSGTQSTVNQNSCYMNIGMWVQMEGYIDTNTFLGYLTRLLQEQRLCSVE